ncbi:MAG: nucleoside-diphosphate kinase [Candidatus Nanohalobium sp.]
MNSESPEYAMVVLKPDAIERGLEDEVYDKLESAGFSVEHTSQKELSREDVGRQYAHVAQKDDLDNNVVWGIHEYLDGREVEAAVLNCENLEDNPTEVLETAVGSSPYPEKEDPDSIRGAAVNNPESPFYDKDWIRLYDSRSADRTGGEGVRNLVHFPERGEDVDEPRFDDEFERDLDIYFGENTDTENSENINSEIKKIV